MLLKSADDKSQRIAMLESLQRAARLKPAQRDWLTKELRQLRTGIQGERDAAHYLDNYFKDDPYRMVIHDLRIEVDDEVAQIDHLIMNRSGGMYLIETKNYGGNLVINEQGEFTAEYEGHSYGIQSPIEQSKRHERILSKLLKRLDISKRFGDGIGFFHVVLLHPRAIIKRPSAKLLDTSMVIKADQFPSWHQQFIDKTSVTEVLKSLTNVRSTDTLKDWAEKLLRQHCPSDPLWLPDFMQQPAAPAPTPVVAPQPITETAATYTTTPTPATADSNPIAKKLICAHCHQRISYPEGKFCWNNVPRFGGLQYCREHQALF